MPIKHGFRESGEVTPENVAQFHSVENCPLRTEAGEIANDVHNARIQSVKAPIFNAMTFYRYVCSCGAVGVERHFTFEARQAAIAHAENVTLID